jgi:hypothetical protein
MACADKRASADLRLELIDERTAIVREEIMRTVSDAADVEAESRELCEALIAAEGKILP